MRTTRFRQVLQIDQREADQKAKLDRSAEQTSTRTMRAQESALKRYEQAHVTWERQALHLSSRMGVDPSKLLMGTVDDYRAKVEELELIKAAQVRAAIDTFCPSAIPSDLQRGPVSTVPGEPRGWPCLGGGASWRRGLLCPHRQLRPLHARARAPPPAAQLRKALLPRLPLP